MNTHFSLTETVRKTACLLLFAFVTYGLSEAQEWIPANREAKPYTRWWWPGNAVDYSGIDYNLNEFAKVGIGGVEITPIYGVQGNDANDIQFLSPKWMKMLNYVEKKAASLGMETTMVTGTGWPFGGPLVTTDNAACKISFDEKGNPIVGRTGQLVSRAAPGGEGFVIDHFDHDAVAHYLQRFDTAFVNQKVPFPTNMFNDSYEVYDADWTPKLYDEFKARRGYDFKPFTKILMKPDSLRTDSDRRIISDYRATMGELILENFTQQWTDWVHQHGSLTRNQAHGSPANLLDVYAAVDIPECEGFGLTDFGILGLRTDSGHTRKNYSDISMLKYASSAAHVTGKNITSSETFTWLTEHFRTSLSQCKPDLDLMFLSGVNHVFFHGSCYSPQATDWPGWRFYASVDMSPNDNWWDAMPAFTKYIERCQAFLQWGQPDNDVLLYLPYYDMLYDQPGTVALFEIQTMDKQAPRFIEAVQTLIKSGYDVDYVSDHFLLSSNVADRYKTILIPDVRFMPLASLRRLMQIAEQGGQVVFVGSFPKSVPGYGVSKKDSIEFNALLKTLQKKVSFNPRESVTSKWGRGSIVTSPTYNEALRYSSARKETMHTEQGLSCIRRSNDEGYHYFVSNLQGRDIDDYVKLGVNAKSVALYNPMNGKIDLAKTDQYGRVRLQLRSGESIILRTYNTDHSSNFKPHSYLSAANIQTESLKNWSLSFKKSAPVKIEKTFEMKNSPLPWTALGDTLLNETMATGVYKTSFSVKDINDKEAFILDLGDVREYAHVNVNGHDAGILFAVPFRIDITEFLHEGVNTLEVEVANLPANRISKMDRDGIVWRKFKEINMVDLNYEHTFYNDWAVMPSGLNSEVKLIRCLTE